MSETLIAVTFTENTQVPLVGPDGKWDLAWRGGSGVSTCYRAGETAGFPQAQADALVAARKATYVQAP